jgi:hypothetical protein
MPFGLLSSLTCRDNPYLLKFVKTLIEIDKANIFIKFTALKIRLSATIITGKIIR